MKGVKGRILKKLKSIPQVGYLKQTRILQLNASDGLSSSLDPSPPRRRGRGRVLLRELSPVFFRKEEDEEEEEEEEDHHHHHHRNSGLCKTPSSPSEPDIIDVSELMRDLQDDEEEEETRSGRSSNNIIGNKENVRPPASVPKDRAATPGKREISENRTFSPCSGFNCKPRHGSSSSSSELDTPSFRRPDLNSGSLFDPDLLAAFEQAVMDHHIRTYEQLYSKAARTSAAPAKEDLRKEDEEKPPPPPRPPPSEDPLTTDFEEKCPPGGSETVVLYTTSIRGIRKTFEDCNSVRFLLGSLKVLFYERDVSMHLEYREELWRVLGGGGRVIPPRLFVRGRYIGGADEVLGLHERGKLLPLLRGLPTTTHRPGGVPCEGCGGFRFVPCSDCSGSRKVVYYHHSSRGDDAHQSVRCPRCNENGLIPCPLLCCSI